MLLAQRAYNKGIVFVDWSRSASQRVSNVFCLLNNLFLSINSVEFGWGMKGRTGLGWTDYLFIRELFIQKRLTYFFNS